MSKRKRNGGKVKRIQPVKLETAFNLATAIVNLITALILLRIAMAQ